jgi:hypothetical protein
VHETCVGLHRFCPPTSAVSADVRELGRKNGRTVGRVDPWAGRAAIKPPCMVRSLYTRNREAYTLGVCRKRPVMEKEGGWTHNTHLSIK